MIPKKDHFYFIDYKPDEKDSSETSYRGLGLFSGLTTNDASNVVLYWMENLQIVKGFTPGGWFSSVDIKAELNYEQERETA